MCSHPHVILPGKPSHLFFVMEGVKFFFGKTFPNESCLFCCFLIHLASHLVI